MFLFYNLPIRKKLLFLYTPLVIVPMIVMTAISFRIYSNEMNDNMVRYVKQSVYQINLHIDTYTEELERLSLLPYFHNDIIRAMESPSDKTNSFEYYNEYKIIDRLFAAVMTNPREDLLQVYLYKMDGRMFFTSRAAVNLKQNYDWQRSRWFRSALENNGRVGFVGNSTEDVPIAKPPNRMFSVTRLVKSENGKVLGAMLIDVNFNGLASLLEHVRLGQRSNVLVFDENRKLLYAKNELYVDALNASDLGTPSDVISIDGQSYYIGSELSSKTQWRTVVIVPFDELNQSVELVQKIMLGLLIVFVGAMAGLTLWVSSGITKPIMALRRLMRHMEMGNYKVRFQSKYSDEVGDLGRTFNRMSEKIDELVNQVYGFRLRQKEAELNNLKLQIRPHFIYNTLESMRALAEIKDNHEIAEISASLGAMLRYSVKTQNELVLIEKEIEQIRHYLTIQRICMDNAIDYAIDIDDDVRRLYTLPLLLQPIVENAVQHGLFGKKGGFVRITGEAVGEELVFRVEDNGRGLSPERLDAINRILRSAGTEETETRQVGIGLINVNTRIQLMFGDDYGIRFESEPNVGTTVTVRVPARTH